jgi:hypothetical protein
MNIELRPPALDYINSKFNILLKIDVRDIDQDWTILLNLLEQIKIDQFQPNDRILICHMDTDYYDPLMPVGTSINNLVRCFKKIDIPFFLLLFVTNHYGIQKEFDLLLPTQHPKDRPTIIETLLSDMLLGEIIETDDTIEIDKIQKAGLCMIGHKRSHRVALVNFFKKHSLLDKIAVSANFKD